MTAYTIRDVLKSIYIPCALNTGTCTNRLWQRAGWPVSFCGPTQDSALATVNTGRTRQRFGNNEGERTGKVVIRNNEGERTGKKEIPGSGWSMQSYILTRSRLYRENLGTPDYQQRGLSCLRPRCGKIRVGVMNSVKFTRCHSVLDSTMDIPQDFSAADRDAKEALDTPPKKTHTHKKKQKTNQQKN